MTDFEEFAAALRAWANQMAAIRVALRAAHTEWPTDLPSAPKEA
jgi:hypothetical protein